MGPSMVLVALVIIPSMVAGTGIERDLADNTLSPINPILHGRPHFVADNTSSPTSPILRDDNDLDEGQHYRESDDARRPLLHAKRMRLTWYQKQQHCKWKQRPESWACHSGWKYKCFEKRCRRNVSPISQGKQGNELFYDKKGYVKCSSDGDCLTYWKNLEAKTPGAIPCTYDWKEYACEKGFRYGCARKSKLCWRELKNLLRGTTQLETWNNNIDADEWAGPPPTTHSQPQQLKCVF